MWEYTEKVKEYYRNPKNVGEIEDADAIGEHGSLVCGDALKLFLKINDGIIVDAKFQTFGCGSAVASSSALTEMIKGMTVDEAEKITNEDIVKFLGGLPHEKIHCSVMGREALEDAIANYKGTPIEKSPADKVVCKCFGTTEKKLRHMIEENHLKTIPDVIDYCKAGGGCGQCQPDIQLILDDVNSPKEPKKEKLTKTQMIIKVNKVLENYISDELRKDGGDIELVDVEDNKVFVKLQGMCKSCPGATSTLKNFVEKTIREHLNEDIEVIDVTE